MVIAASTKYTYVILLPVLSQFSLRCGTQHLHDIPSFQVCVGLGEGKVHASSIRRIAQEIEAASPSHSPPHYSPPLIWMVIRNAKWRNNFARKMRRDAEIMDTTDGRIWTCMHTYVRMLKCSRRSRVESIDLPRHSAIQHHYRLACAYPHPNNAVTHGSLNLNLLMQNDQQQQQRRRRCRNEGRWWLWEKIFGIGKQLSLFAFLSFSRLGGGRHTAPHKNPPPPLISSPIRDNILDGWPHHGCFSSHSAFNYIRHFGHSSISIPTFTAGAAEQPASGEEASTATSSSLGLYTKASLCFPCVCSAAAFPTH